MTTSDPARIYINMDNAQSAKSVWDAAERALVAARERLVRAERQLFLEMQKDRNADPEGRFGSAYRSACEDVSDAKAVVWHAREDYYNVCAREAQGSLFAEAV